MTPEQIGRVQTSFAKIAPIAATVGALFYQRLFELSAAWRERFPRDMRQQIHKLMAMLDLVVDNLGAFEVLRPQIDALGASHTGYGVQAADYDAVQAALIWAMQLSLEEQFTAADEAAWLAAYTMLAEAMQAAGERPMAT